MKIGELASLTGTAIETIRFYEREKLLQAPRRTGANYRVYQTVDADRLAFIRHCRSLDMTLDEIRALLRFADDPQQNCRGVNELLDEHIGHVAERIRELRVLEKELKRLRLCCQAEQAVTDCGIFTGLTKASRTPVAQPLTGHVHGSHGRR
ncbi:MAG TPA: Cd(II)/Pb(II)-responsive transcriptional regulator [Burkholderiaceae bacterium]|nr:Cd(II)/Pb(II)-responsive transcriptional regulator [Burkholderiaceae bacterium]